MACDIQSLLDDAKCFYGLSAQMSRAAELSLWCQIAEGISPEPPSGSVALLSDDGEWYEVSAVELAPGLAILDVNQTPVSPGDNEYLVLENDDDGLLYKFSLTGAPNNVNWQIDTTAIVEPETPTILTAGGNNYALTISSDNGFTAELTQV